MAGNPLDLILSSNTGRPAPGPVVQIPVYAVWVDKVVDSGGVCLAIVGAIGPARVWWVLAGLGRV